jgi:hypothetical protein
MLKLAFWWRHARGSRCAARRVTVAQVMNGRFFAGQQLLADFWDGITNFATGAQGDAGREDDEASRSRPARLLLRR